MLIPHIIEKSILVNLIAIAENVYDPMSIRQTVNFSQLISKLIRDYPTLNYQSANTKVIKYLYGVQMSLYECLNGYFVFDAQFFLFFLKKLIEAVVARLKKCIDQEIFLPLYPKQ